MTTTSFNVSWGSVSNAISYRLDVSTDLFRTFVPGYENLTVNSTTQSITGLTPGTTYYVRVRAVTNTLIGPNSSILTQSTIPVAPNQPIISNVTVETFTASWNNVIGASNYRIDVATTSNFTSGFVEGYNNRTVTGTSINITDLSPGTTYYIRVRAVNDQTTDPVTSINSVSAVQSTQVLTSTAPIATRITTTSFIVNWTNPGDATSYRLDVSTVSNFATRLTGYDNLLVNTKNQLITGLTPGIIYYVRVRSVNAIGIVSANSSTLIQATVPLAPAQLTINSISSSTIALNWSPVNGATSYRVDVSTSFNFSNLIYVNRIENNANHLIVSLAPATTYYIRVRAINNQTANIVTSANSTTISQLTLTNRPSLPFANSISFTGFRVNWARVAGAINYRLDVSTSSDFSTFVIGYENLTVNETNQLITGLIPGTTYYIRVSAINDSGSSLYSQTLTLKTLLPGPTNLNSININNTGFTVNWDNIPDAINYFLDVSLDSNFLSEFVFGYENLTVNETSKSIIGLIPGLIYYVRVRVLTDKGLSVNSEPLIQVTVPVAPNQPVISELTSTSFEAAWNNVIGASEYRIDVATSSNFISGFVTDYNNKLIPGNSNKINITGLTSGTLYYIRVRAVNSQTKNSVTSENSVTAIQLTELPPPNTPTATNITTTGFTVNWNAVTNATSYRVDVSDPTAASVTFPFLNNFLPGYENLTVNGTSLSLTGLTPGQIYYVRVRAVNSDIESENSTSLIQITAPEAPNEPIISDLTSASLQVRWNFVSGASSYRIDISTMSDFTSGFVYNNVELGGTITRALFGGLSHGTTYYVRLRAVNNQTANEVTSVNSVPVILTTVLPVPDLNFLPIYDNTTTSFSVRWGAVINATSYRLDVSTDLFTTFVPGYENLTVNGTIFESVTGLNPGTTYYVRMRAVNAATTSQNSIQVIAITDPLPGSPEAPTPTDITTTSFSLNWSAVVGSPPISYRLDVSTVSNFATRLPGYDNLTVNGTSQIVTGLNSGAIYYVRIRSVDANGTSLNSSTLTITTKLSAPNTPAATNITTTGFTVNWNAVTNATSYRVDVSDPTAASVTFPFLNNFLPGYENLTVNGTSLSLTGLTPGQIYYVRVRAVNSNVTSENSASLIQVTAPLASNFITISQVTSTSFRVNWNNIPNASSYRLDVATTSNFTSGFITNYNNAIVSSTSSLVVGLLPGITYYIRVRAVNNQTSSEVISQNSLTVNQVTPLQSPALSSSTGITTTGFTTNWNSVVNATSYQLDVSTDLFTTFVPGYQNLIINGTTRSITGLTPGTTYYIRVRAVNSATTSQNSLTFSQSTNSLPGSPEAPRPIDITTTSFSLNWNAVVGSPPISYRLDVSTVSNFATRLPGYDNLTVNGTTQIVTGLNSGAIYYVRIRSVDANGTSLNSSTLTITTKLSAPNTPAATNITTTGFTVNWNAVTNATSYRVDVSDPTAASVTFPFLNNFLPGYENLTVNGTSLSLTGLTPGKIYYVRVRAVNSNVTSENSASLIQITVPLAPNQPIISQVTSTSFKATWNDISNASSYRIDIATTSNFTSGFVTGYNNRTVTTTSFNVTGLSPGITYYVRVRAVNNQTANEVISANSSNGNQASVISAPNISVENITTTSFTVNWNLVIGATSYRLDISRDLFTTFIPGYQNLTVNSSIQSILGLTPGTTYYIRARAVSATSTSQNSSTLTQITIPSAPNQPIISEVTSNSFKVTWNNVIGASNYRIDVATTSNFTSGFVNGYNNRIITDNNIDVIGLSSATIYYIRVRAINNQTTNQVISTNSPNAEQRTNLSTPTATFISTSSFTVNWTNVTNASYRLDVSTVSNFATRLPGYDNLTVNGTVQLISGLAPGTIYYVRVRAIISGGLTLQSSTLTQITVPLAPINKPLISSIADDAFEIFWDSVQGAQYYLVDVISTPNIYFENVRVNGTATRVEFPYQVTPNTSYTAKVRAGNDLTANSVIGEYSLVSDPKRTLASSEAPTISNITSNSFIASWKGIPNAISYNINISRSQSGPPYLFSINAGTTNSRQIIGLTPFTDYYVTILIENSSGPSITRTNDITSLRTLPLS
jgi:hypothetical protein